MCAVRVSLTQLILYCLTLGGVARGIRYNKSFADIKMGIGSENLHSLSFPTNCHGKSRDSHGKLLQSLCEPCHIALSILGIMIHCTYIHVCVLHIFAGS